MKNFKKMLLVAAAFVAATLLRPLSVEAQMKDGNSDVHAMSDDYVAPTDSLVLEKLENFRDRKFGVFFHWGLYSVPGISESWPLCKEDRFTARRNASAPRQGMTYDEYKQWYWGLADVFNPTDFNPTEWARLMDDAGFRYMVLTTKHHDGFCMFDSRLTDFNVAKGPYGKDITRQMFDAFRARGFMIGCYFSKPDWHSPYFWIPGEDTPTRHPNYDVSERPELLRKFAEFTHGQIVDELMSGYGEIDILWLDGGWVRKGMTDVGIDSIVDHARMKQPGLIAVDRTIHGRNENYRTPEMTVPKEQMLDPWETNITLGEGWGWHPGAKYHSARATLEKLFEVVAKGGNLLLGVGPDSRGRIDSEALAVLSDVGRWLKANGEAIYGTRPVANYRQENIWFTGSKDGETVYAIFTQPDEFARVPKSISWTGNEPEGEMTLLCNGKRLKYKTENGVTTVSGIGVIFNEPIVCKFKAKKQ